MGKHFKSGAGGKRPNQTGRPKGSKDSKPRKRLKGTREYEARMKASRVLDEIKDERAKKDKHDKPELPLERLMRRMNDPDIDADTRDQLATWAAPYVHAKLSSVALRPGASPVGTDGKATEQAASGKGKITVTMAFDNTGDIKEDEDEVS